MVHPVKPRATRILGTCKAYHRQVDSQLLSLPIRVTSALMGLGPVLGVYQNSEDDCIYVAEEGLLIVDESSTQPVRYKEIKSVDTVGTKEAAEQIVVTTDEGNLFNIFVKNGNGKIRDIWQFWRFLDRVSRDVRARADEDRASLVSPAIDKKLLFVGRVAPREQLERALSGYWLEYATDVPHLSQQINKHKFDLIVINDVTLPELHANSIIKAIRSQANVPVLVFTNNPKEIGSLADVSAMKPVDPTEVIARIKAMLRRSSS